MDDSERWKYSNNEQLSNIMNLNKSDSQDESTISKPTTSLGTLVVWNISKALEKNPTINIKDAITTAQSRLEQLSDTEEVHTILSEHPCQRNLLCALLAWQELGHQNADSLCKFVENRRNDQEHANNMSKSISKTFDHEQASNELRSKFAKAVVSSSKYPYSMGPVVKLPVETKIVMRVENTPGPGPRQQSRNPKSKDIMNKIDQACCLDSECAKRLADMDASTAELRKRAAQLALREAERVALLERAEAAWKNLELGYQKRLTLAEEKEEDMAKQIQNVISERNNFKTECTTLAQQLREKGDKAESDRVRLATLEKTVCERACARLKLSEESAREDGIVADHQSLAQQVDRDCQFKEEQARRKITNLESQIDSARALTYETERALRSELSALRTQIENVSKQLLKEAADNDKIKASLEDLRQEKMGLIEDLDGCKLMCDGRMKGRIDDLKKKRDQLSQLKEKVLECRCQVPVDAMVEVKRTPSLAALCKCAPEDKVLGSCSCTSLRGRLLTNLLADLFGGLQAELGESVTDMPCQLLKCLEDKHNWDKATIVKTNLKDYFSKLLIGEINIAIATSIENYHSKWVGETCADAVKCAVPGPGEDQNEGWQERAIERRAQKLATELAEQLFKERAEELTKRAKSIVSAGPPPCECKPKASTQPAVYPCLVKNKPVRATQPTQPGYWHLAMQDVTQLRMEIEELKKDSIKKEDLKMMENKFAKIIQRASGGTNTKTDGLTSGNPNNDFTNKDRKINRAVNYSGIQSDLNKPSYSKKRYFDSTFPIRKSTKPSVLLNSITDKTSRPFRKNGQTYSVNMCLCSVPKEQKNVTIEKSKPDNSSWKQNASKDAVSQMSSSIRQSKPINASLISQDTTIIINDSKTTEQSCPSNCVCFHKIPSNTSIDKLLETLAKWKCDLDATCNDKDNSKTKGCMFNEPNAGCILDVKKSLNKQDSLTNIKDSLKEIKSKTSFKSIDKSDLRPTVKKHDCLRDSNSIDNSGLKQPIGDSKPSKISKKSGKIYVKSTGPIVATESEYMGAINLDKSDEDLCKCDKKAFTNKTNNEEIESNVIKCINSSKCSCDKNGDVKNFQKKTSRIKKELHPETSSVHTKKERQLKDIVLDNMTKNRSKYSTLNYNDTDSHYKLNDSKIVPKNSEPNDYGYQIKFLGVTLADTNCNNKYKTSLESSKINYDILPNKKNILTNNTVGYSELQIQNKRSSKTFHESFQEKPVNKDNDKNMSKWFEGVTDSAKNINRNKNDKKPFEYAMEYEVGKIDKNMILSCNKKSSNKLILNTPEKYDTYHEKDDQFKISGETKEQQKLLNVLKKSSNIQTKQDVTLCKIDCASSRNKNNVHKLQNQNITHLRYDVSHSRVDSTKSSDLGASSLNNAQLPNKSDKLHTREIISDMKDLSKDIPACKCNIRFDEFKNFINATFGKQAANDIALDVQSFTDYKKQNESCVCCDRLNMDDSNDLEENAFHLLEEYLKKKLDEFKESSCSSNCIPPAEEQKLFTIILERVKKLISDSTNQIACKCSPEEEKSQGSWNRAYGLLQEYLKIKIKKVQCSCILAEDNNDTVLPEVLEKVCHLIEYDFQRLKDVCGCKNDQSKKENCKPLSKQNNCEVEIPEKDSDNMVSETPKNCASTYVCSQIIYHKLMNTISFGNTTNIKQNTSAQVPSKITMDVRSCSPIEIHNKNMQTIVNSHYKVNLPDPNYKDYICISNINTTIINTDENKTKRNVSSVTFSKDSYKEKNYIESVSKDTQLTSEKSDRHDLYSELKEEKSSPCVGYPVECVYKGSFNSNVINKAIIEASTNLNNSLESLLSESDIQKLSCNMVNNIPIEYTLSDEQSKDIHGMYLTKEDNKKQICTHIPHKAESELIGDNKVSVSQTSDIWKNNHICKSMTQEIHADEYCKETLDHQFTDKKPNAQSNESVIMSDISTKYPNGPYIGYTVDCSCDSTLETCVCSKSMSKAENDMINNIWKKSLPDETYFRKVSYILNSRPVEDINYIPYNLDAAEDISFKGILKKNCAKRNFSCERETGISCNDGEDFRLKNSKENFEKTHTMINTLDDNFSVDTEYSNNEDILDWYECCSNIKPTVNSDSERLKSSIYFPVPLADFPDNCKDKKSANHDHQNTLHGLAQRCECDMVPICHVKMLVENIETKLAAAKCTCDSLIPQVCPEHKQNIS